MESAELELEGEACAAEKADESIMSVPRLRMLVDSLKSCPPCFWGLIPDKVLLDKELPGRQLRGVGCCPNTSLFDVLV